MRESADRTKRAPAGAIALFALALALVAPSGAPAAEVAVPEPLEPWVTWVLAEHPDLPCPLVAGDRLCGWPGRLELDLDERGGTFRLEALADRPLDLALPGDAARWPRGVTDNGRPALLRRTGERPRAALAPGRHRIEGRFRWSRLPEALPVPPEIGLVSVAVGGRPLPHPRREESGLLWLAAGRGAEAEEERVGVEVVRRIDDGVPVRLTVRLTLRVSGRAREVDLGVPLPPGFAPTSLASALPVRLVTGAAGTQAGSGPRLLVQLRPGDWEIVLEARSLGPVTEIGLAERPQPWPEEEFWVFQADLTVRSVRLGGAAAVDPQRTPLPEAWWGLPAFRVRPGESLALVELRRGQPEPVPDEITGERDWWLAEKGDRITSRDRLAGRLNVGGRLESAAPAALGRVSLGPAAGDQVITLGPSSELPGVEVREGELDLTADLVYPRRGGLPAVGWSRDARSLSIRLNLPPGWTLLAAPGADRAVGAWLDEWTLLDLFFLLLVALATWKLDSWRWGALAIAALGLSWHEPHAGALVAWWLTLLPLKALVRVLRQGRLASVLRAARWIAALGLGIQLVVFCFGQWRTGLFPQLEHESTQVESGAPAASYQAYVLEALAFAAKRPTDAEQVRLLPEPKRADLPAAPALPPGKGPLEYARSRQMDAGAVVQTGPGVPGWRWNVCTLSWSGPVTADQTVRLLLVSPWVERLLSLLRIAGVALLGLALLDLGGLARWGTGSGGRAGGSGGEAAGAAALAALLLAAAAPARAQEAQEAQVAAESQGAQEVREAATGRKPPPGAGEPFGPPAPGAGLLAELERRLTAPPPCAPDCIEVPALTLSAGARGLTVEAEVHAAAPSAWKLPGPAQVWVPAQVTVDGGPASALRRGDDGFLLLRLETGVHRVTLSGPARDSLTLQMPLPPRAMEWRGQGWAITGYRPDAPPPPSVRLDRLLPLAQSGADDGGGAAAELAPWLELSRELDLGIPWLAHTELRRLGPSDAPVAVRVPLLPGEAVTTADVPVERGEAVVTLERGESVRRWRSTLEETPSLTLAAPTDRPWMERWVLACSPIWSCRAEGLAPVGHMEGGRWRPEWRPWPGESVTLHFVRPAPAPGATVTLDAARLALTPGRRMREGRLELDLRTSQGGEQTVALPEGATLRSFAMDGSEQPVQFDGGRLRFTLEPGDHRLVTTWQERHTLGLLDIAERVPAVDVGAPAVNVRIDLEVPANRWLLWTGGPRWGSVVTLWLYLPLLVLAAWALGRWAPPPLSFVDWLLLGVGLTQVPLPAAAVVVVWLLVFSAPVERLPSGRVVFWIRQGSLGLLWLAALGVLYAAVHAGLLGRPEMQIEGPGTANVLSWYADRAAGPLPRPWALWLPLWVFRFLMLAWALWLSARLVRWLPWAWRRFVSRRAEPQEGTAAEQG